MRGQHTRWVRDTRASIAAPKPLNLRLCETGMDLFLSRWEVGPIATSKPTAVKQPAVPNKLTPTKSIQIPLTDVKEVWRDGRVSFL